MKPPITGYDDPTFGSGTPNHMGVKKKSCRISCIHSKQALLRHIVVQSSTTDLHEWVNLVLGSTLSVFMRHSISADTFPHGIIMVGLSNRDRAFRHCPPCCQIFFRHQGFQTITFERQDVSSEIFTSYGSVYGIKITKIDYYF